MYTVALYTVTHSLCALFDPRPSTNQSTGFKSGSVFLVMVSVRPYVTYVRKKYTNQSVEPFYKLVHWLVLGRGSWYYSSLVSFFFEVKKIYMEEKQKKVEEAKNRFYLLFREMYLGNFCSATIQPSKT